MFRAWFRPSWFRAGWWRHGSSETPDETIGPPGSLTITYAERTLGIELLERVLTIEIEE